MNIFAVYKAGDKKGYVALELSSRQSPSRWIVYDPAKKHSARKVIQQLKQKLPDLIRVNNSAYPKIGRKYEYLFIRNNENKRT